MPRITEYEEHTRVTHLNQRRYQFTPKHHGCDPSAACWCEELSREQEFEVFDNADLACASDDNGNHYGVARGPVLGLLTLGTWGQQVAEFPAARDGEPWHGYPLYPLNEEGPENRSGERLRPPKQVFVNLEKAALISKRDRKRLMKGEHV